jgi:hypothetical protein
MRFNETRALYRQRSADEAYRIGVDLARIGIGLTYLGKLVAK